MLPSTGCRSLIAGQLPTESRTDKSKKRKAPANQARAFNKKEFT